MESPVKAKPAQLMFTSDSKPAAFIFPEQGKHVGTLGNLGTYDLHH